MQKKVNAKMQLSPRLGIAYPITDRGVIHFSYGHFYQMPSFNNLVNNQRRFLGISQPLFGNANLEPQKTVAFEVGWDQQLTEFLAVTVTGFYKDIENLVSTDVYQSAQPTTISYYINQDFANVRGVEINLRTRRYYNFTSLPVIIFRLAFSYHEYENAK